MDDDRKTITAAASDLFVHAKAAGLDFRMGVTNMVRPGKPGYGKLCSDATDPTGLGGDDRFILPSEQTLFEACILNPPGDLTGAEVGEDGIVNVEGALKAHLPREPSNPNRFRKDAESMVVVLTDEMDASVAQAVGSTYENRCTLPQDVQQMVNYLLDSYLDLLDGKLDPEMRVSRFFVLGGLCGNTCKALVSHGYREVVAHVGGLMADVCQKNVSSTLQLFVDDMVAGISRVPLQRVPIASSLAASVGGTPVARSRSAGFDYRASGNALVFTGTTFTKGARILVSYKRWDGQLVLK